MLLSTIMLSRGPLEGSRARILLWLNNFFDFSLISWIGLDRGPSTFHWKIRKTYSVKVRGVPKKTYRMTSPFLTMKSWSEINLRIFKITSPSQNIFHINKKILKNRYTMGKMDIFKISQKTQLELWSKRKKPMPCFQTIKWVLVINMKMAYLTNLRPLGFNRLYNNHK